MKKYLIIFIFLLFLFFSFSKPIAHADNDEIPSGYRALTYDDNNLEFGVDISTKVYVDTTYSFVYEGDPVCLVPNVLYIEIIDEIKSLVLYSENNVQNLLATFNDTYGDWYWNIGINDYYVIESNTVIDEEILLPSYGNYLYISDILLDIQYDGNKHLYYSKEEIYNMNSFPSLDLDYNYKFCFDLDGLNICTFSECYDNAILQNKKTKVYVLEDTIKYGKITYMYGSTIGAVGSFADDEFITVFEGQHYRPVHYFLDPAITNDVISMEELKSITEDISKDIYIYCTVYPIPYYTGSTSTIYKNSSSIVNLSYLISQLSTNFTDPDKLSLIFEVVQDDYTGNADVIGNHVVKLKVSNSFGEYIVHTFNFVVVENLGVDAIIGNNFYISNDKTLTKESFINVLKNQGIAPSEQLSVSYDNIDDYFSSPTEPGVYSGIVSWETSSSNNGQYT